MGACILRSFCERRGHILVHLGGLLLGAVDAGACVLAALDSGPLDYQLA
jgi:hypothetical protein